MIKELDLVAITHDINDYGLTTGDLGTVVHCYEDNLGFEIEFVTASGQTIAVLTLTDNDIRLLENQEIFHVRNINKLVA